MTRSANPNGADAQQQPPALKRDAAGRIDSAALADLIQWFLDRDPRVNAVRHPRAEEVFQWKQRAARRAGDEVFQFDTAEDRLAVGVVQALMANPDERALHGWIAQLLNALDDAASTNEEITSAYRLDPSESAVAESGKIPAAEAREVYLTCCWLEVLCTAEARVLGWVYQELYGRPFQP
ncbi:MAG TPA: hypothetical protein VIP46_19355 [Pyrinomonadaceae bacterium]